MASHCADKLRASKNVAPPEMEKLSVQRDGINPNATRCHRTALPGRKCTDELQAHTAFVRQDSKELRGGAHREKDEQKGRRQGRSRRGDNNLLFTLS